MNDPISAVAGGAKVPVGDGRFPSRNIRLSAALCSLGFILRDDADPLSRTIDVATKTQVVTFWHSPVPMPGSPILFESPKITAAEISAWWNAPGKFTVPGFDDALAAIRRVLEAREWLLALVFGARRIVNQRFGKGSVVTSSIRFASILKACGFELVAFEKMPGRGDDRFVFPAAAAPAIELIASEEQGAGSREKNQRLAAASRSESAKGRTRRGELPAPSSKLLPPDACVDWMLWGLEYHGRLMRKVKAAPAMIELRDGDRVCRVHSEMPQTLRREFIRNF